MRERERDIKRDGSQLCHGGYSFRGHRVTLGPQYQIPGFHKLHSVVVGRLHVKLSALSVKCSCNEADSLGKK